VAAHGANGVDGGTGSGTVAMAVALAFKAQEVSYKVRFYLVGIPPCLATGLEEKLDKR